MHRRWQLLAGLFLTTLATLLLELMNTRLLSVMTWYHLSFFAVSTAMFGMSAGAIKVYLGGKDFEGDNARAALTRWSVWLALSIPLTHVLILCIPIQLGTSVVAISGLVFTTLAVATPFYVSGVIVAIALTRIPGPPGLIYAVDLLGAAAGSLLILPLLENLDISSIALICGAIAAVAAALFHSYAATRRAGRGAALALAVALAGLALINSGTREGLRVTYSKGRTLVWDEIISESWSIHGRVLIKAERKGRPWYWGAGNGTKDYRVAMIPMDIDGMAATVITKWDGKNPDDLIWTSHDVSSLPYHIRAGGDVAVIGVGGGRDLLTALWARSRSVTGVEINGALLDALEGPFSDYAGLAGRPEVKLVRDEARSYFTRTDKRFDVLQMTMIDTWAATGAGAFTLSENGLYTIEGWNVFMRVLKPKGIFSVSRWYSRKRVSETTRLLSLATATLLDLGADKPQAHLMLVTRRNAATLMVSPSPFSKQDVSRVMRVSNRMGFRVQLAPGLTSTDPLLSRIVSSRDRAELDAAVAHEHYDYSPPTDQRPYFFNVLKPGSAFGFDLSRAGGHLVDGNLLATRTLSLLWMLSVLLVVLAILWPLARSGRPNMEAGSFPHALLYFSIIGFGFMMVQIPMIQRFSVYLGHPTYAVAVILFSMILATGLGSLLSDRIPIEENRTWALVGPLGIALILFLAVLAIQPVIDATIRYSLLVRCSVVVAMLGVVAFPLGFCFPLGLRLVRRISEDATPWMWGVNGAFSVLSSVSSVWISMWSGIDTSLFIAVAVYLLLPLPATALWARGQLRSSRG